MRKALIICFIVFLSFPLFSDCAFTQNTDELLIEIAIREINWSYSGQESNSINVGLDVIVSYFGTDPPKAVFLSHTLDSTDADQSNATLFDLTEAFGPWVVTGNNRWGLNQTRAPQNLGHLPEYFFSFDDNQIWPNERLNTEIFSAFTLRRISGKINTQITPRITTVNIHPEEHDYYWLWVNTLSINPSGFKASAINYTDEPRGCFFSLVLSHELTIADSFEYVPLLLTIVYPALMVLLLFAVILSTLKYFKWIIGSVLTINFAMIVLLFTIQSQIKDYVPFWENSIYSAFLGCFMYLIILLAITIIVALIGKSNFNRGYSFAKIRLNRIYISLKKKIGRKKSKSKKVKK